MSISQSIAPHLPHLRRFARALTGSQRSGDAYVVETLEAIVADPNGFPAADVRCGLYKLFLKLWGSVSVNGQTEATTTVPELTGGSHSLDAISLQPRVALLLTALEGFDMTEVARTMDVSVPDAKSLLDRANSEISEQISTDVLIIEDEPLIAMDLQNVVEELGHRVADVARTHRQALKAIEEHRPGLILADIQLADGSSGLEAVNEILESLEVPVIFITAYPERFLTGAPPEPAFLIAKPFGIEQLRALISQVLFFNQTAHRSTDTKSVGARV
jgi:CheY-like chemotaxis protein